MEALEQLHKQLDSLDDLRSIVKTMKALSAASIRQYEQAVAALAGYYQTVERGLYVVLKDMQQAPSSAGRSHGQVAAIVFGSDHGLCGRFNEEISDYTVQRLNTMTPVKTAAAEPERPKRRLILTVGARIAASLEHKGETIDESYLVPGSAAHITSTVQQILLQIDAWREQAGVQSVYLFYNRHTEGQGYQSTALELLPVDLQRLRQLEEGPWPGRSLPTFSMDRPALLSHLLQQYLFVSIFRACAESQAAEHASRLAAMQAAQRNLDDRFDEVTTQFRRARQNSITSELLDVVSGFEAITAVET